MGDDFTMNNPLTSNTMTTNTFGTCTFTPTLLYTVSDSSALPASPLSAPNIDAYQQTVTQSMTVICEWEGRRYQGTLYLVEGEHEPE